MMGPGLAKGTHRSIRQRRRRGFVVLGSAEAVLSERELRALFTEIAFFGESVCASQKLTLLAPEAPAESLPRLFHSLSAREIFGAQITYEYWGARRCDTLLARPEGVVCVRQESLA